MTNMAFDLSKDFSLVRDQVVWVTGGAGFIGSHLSDQLLAVGAYVVGFDNFLTGREDNLSQVAEDPNKKARFILVEADIGQALGQYLDQPSLVQAFAKPQDWSGKGRDWLKPTVIFHLASPASPPQYQSHPILTYRTNAFGTHYLLEYLEENNPQGRFVFASTSEVYGDPLKHPQTEDYWGNVNPNGPRSCYDESKRLGETICGVFHQKKKLDTRIMRIFNTYGPRMDPEDGRVIPNFIQAVLGNEPFPVYGKGEQTRSYCFVDDQVKGILALALKDGLAGETVNIGNPEEYTIAETALTIARLIKDNKQLQLQDLDIEYRPLPVDDPTKRKPDISKAQKLLGWQPEVSFEEGLGLTVEYFRGVKAL